MPTSRVTLALLFLSGCGRIGFDQHEAYRDAVIADRPIGYWRLGETSGPIARDEMRRVDGQYGGGCAFEVAGALVGSVDTAVDFDGTSCVVDLGDEFAFPGNAPFSIEAWVSPMSRPGFQHVFTRQVTNAGPPVDGYAVVFNSPTGVYLERAVASVNVSSARAMLTHDVFAHVVGVYDGALLQIYADGVPPGSAISAPDAMLMFAGPANIGSGRNVATLFSGVIDEVALYDRALAPDRIKAHYELGIR